MLTVQLSLTGVNIGDFFKIYFKIFFEFCLCSERQHFVDQLKNEYLCIISVLTGKKNLKICRQKDRIGYDYL